MDDGARNLRQACSVVPSTHSSRFANREIFLYRAHYDDRMMLEAGVASIRLLAISERCAHSMWGPCRNSTYTSIYIKYLNALVLNKGARPIPRNGSA